MILGIIALVKGAVETQKTLSILGIIFSVLVIFTFILGGKALLSTFGESSKDAKDQVIEQTTEQTKEETIKKGNKFEAVDVKWLDESYFTYLVGTIENTRDKKISYISVKFILYDANGNQVGTASDSTTDLGAGATWSFKAAVFEKEAVDFKIEEISTW